MQLLARIGRHGDHVARLELDAPGRQLELGAFAPGPQILQPGIGEALRLGAAGDDGAVRPRLPPARAGQAARGHRGATVIRIAFGEADLHLLRQLGLLRAGELERRLLVAEHEIVLRQMRDRAAAAALPRDGAATRHRIDAEQAQQRLERAAHRHRPVDHIAVDETVDGNGAWIDKAEIAQDAHDQPVESRAFDPAR